MWRKTLNFGWFLAAAGALVIFGFVLGVAVAGRANLANGPVQSAGVSSTPDMALFWQTWNLVNQKFLNAPTVSDDDKVRGAAAGLVASLGDPYSEFFSPKDAETFQEDVTGNFGGIGAELDLKQGIVTVVAPIKGSPAEAAGLKPGDQILLVDATSTENMAIEQVVNYIRGPKGTSVKLTVMRQGWDKPKQFTLTRETVAAPTLDYKMLDGKIAYIQLYQFNANADTLFNDAIRKAALGGANGIILDLRGNPGGYLDVAVDLAGWFLPRGAVVVSQKGRAPGTDDVMRAAGNAALVNVPTVVLVDDGSASAAEILSGALRDQRHVPLVGATTFGKGTVQELETLADGSLVKLTIAHWVLPSGKILEDGGLKPDYEVKLTEDDIKAGRDPQLDKAVEVLKKQLGN